MNFQELLTKTNINVCSAAYKPFKPYGFYGVNGLSLHNKIYYAPVGKCEWQIRGERYVPSPNSLMFVPADAVVEYKIADGLSADDTLMAYYSFESRVDGINIFDYINFDLTANFEPEFDLQALFIKGAPESGSDDICRDLWLKSVVCEILYHFFKRTRFIQETERYKSSIDFRAVLLFIDKTITQRPITLDDLSNFVHISPSYFSREFKKTFGMSPMKYVDTLRMEKIAKLLGNKSVSLTDIADNFNFSGASSLSRYVKSHTGLSPKEFRNRALLK